MNANRYAVLLLRLNFADLAALRESLRAAELSEASAVALAESLARLAARERALSLLVFACAFSCGLAENDAPALRYAGARAAAALAELDAIGTQA